jgi:hypothetical protein
LFQPGFRAIGKRIVVIESMEMQIRKWLICSTVILSTCACQTKTTDNGSESRDIAMLKYNDSIQRDSIRQLSEGLSRLEQATAGASHVKGKTVATETGDLPANNASVSSGKPSSAIKAFALLDTLHVSDRAVILSNTCRWYFKSVEETKDTTKGKRECNFHGAKDIVYLDGREISLDDIKRTRDYEFDAGAKLRTYCPNITLVLECR